LGNRESIFKSVWPKCDNKLLKDEVVNFVIQINGKLRVTLEVSADISESEAFQLAQENETIKKWLPAEKTIKKIFVPGKLLNIVVK
jgi:leucyl-tRNA synthetase